MKDYLDKILEKQIDHGSIWKLHQEQQHYQKTRLSGTKIGYLKSNLALNLIETYIYIYEIFMITCEIQQQQTILLVQVYQKIHTFKLSEALTLLDKIIIQLKKQLALNALLNHIQQNVIKKQDQELNKCSFQPQINDGMLDMEQLVVNGYGQTVERLRRANDHCNLREIQLNHKPSGEIYEKLKRMAYIHPDMLQRSKVQKEIPIFNIDIKIGPSKVGRLALRKKDNNEELVKSFCIIWGVALQDYDLLLNQVKENLKKESKVEDQ